MAKLINPWAGGIILTVGIVLIIVFRHAKDDEKVNFSMKKAGIAVSETCIGAAAAYYFYRSITEFSDQWGAQRGKIWTESFMIFGRFSIKKKLTGTGPELLKDQYASVSQWLGQTVLVSHCEPIQYLLTMGAVGVVLWFFIWAAIIFCHFRVSHTCKARGILFSPAFFFPLMAYWGQAFFNSAMTQIIAVLFVFIAMERINENTGSVC